jgi:hypothetical protein
MGQQGDTVAIGANAGYVGQQGGAIAIGANAGQTNQQNAAIAIGNSAGSSGQQSNAIAIGNSAGATGQQGNAIAIGKNAGNSGQQSNAIAVGNSAGSSGQQSNAIAIGNLAGQTNQQGNAIAIGNSAGSSGQQSNAIAIGNSAGSSGQQGNAIAIGSNAGNLTQGQNAVAVGIQAGQNEQKEAAVAIGLSAGRTNQGASSVAIGNNAGAYNQGASAIAIGNQAGATGQPNNSIVLNATGAALNPVNTGFFVKPLRATSDTSSNTSSQLVYNQISGEMQYLTTINGQTSAKFNGSGGIGFVAGIANDFKGVECWFKANKQYINNPTLVSRYATSSSPFQFALVLESDSSSLAESLRGSVRFHISHNANMGTQLNTKLKRYDDNLWHHVAATFDSRAATFTGSFTISGGVTTLTVSNVIGTISVNQLVYGTNVTTDTRIINGSGTTWTVNKSQTGAIARGSVFSTATFNGSFATTTTSGVTTTTLTVSNVTGTISVGQLVYGSDVNNDTYITGSSGTNWMVNKSQTITNATGIGSAEPSKMYIYMDGGVEVVDKSTVFANIRGQDVAADSDIRNLQLGIGTDHAWITNNSNLDRYFVGNISDVRIWNIFRPLDRVVFDHKLRLYGTETGLVFYAKLDETAGAYKTTPIPSTYTQTGSVNVVPDTAPISASKTFVIDHPIHPNKYLVHACLEGPESGVYYRGKGEIVNGTSVEVQLPAYVSVLCRGTGTDFTVQLTPIYDGIVRTSMLYASEVDPATNSFHVYGENGRFNWLVHGKRFDIEVEPKKADMNKHGDGPYTYLSKKNGL